MTSARLALVAVLLAAHVQQGLSTCPIIDDVLKNNWPEDEEGIMVSQPAPGVTNVTWKPGETTDDHYDVNGYVDVIYNETTEEIEFIALSGIAGIRDFPSPPNLSKMTGTCLMHCGNDEGTFLFQAFIKDRNTASPEFVLDKYEAHVKENFPEGFTIPDLVISARDADADAANYELSFALQEGSPFELTPAQKTADMEPTYTTQLKVTKPLNWTAVPSYTLTITATDPGSKTATASVTVYVDDVDNQQPEFSQAAYSATVDDPETPTVLDVSITAVDPDAPGKLSYTLKDASEGQLSSYFSLNPSTAEFSLVKDISDQLQTYPTTATFIVQATEDGGNGFYCRSALVVSLPPLMITTTTTEPTTTPTMSTSSEIPTTTPVTSPSSTDTTVTTPMTSSAPPDTTTSTPVTSSTSTDTTVTTPMTSSAPPDTTTSTPVTSSTSTDTTVTTPMTSSAPPDTTTSTTVTSSTSTDTTLTTPVTSTPTTPVTMPSSTDSTGSTMTSPSSLTTVTSSATTQSTAPVTPSSAPTPSPPPCPMLLFPQRQHLASATERQTGDVTTVTADPAAGDVTYFLRTPGYEDVFALDENTGTLRKLIQLKYQQISLLVQAIPPSGVQKNQTNNTDVVDLDETLIIVDIIDENDSPPVLDCSAYADSCDTVVVGFPASDTAALPTPLLQLTVTDADTGMFGVDGVQYTVNSAALKVDSSGVVYLLKQQSEAFTAKVTAADNNGDAVSLTDTATVTLVPIRDDQIFYIRADSQLTDAASVTDLLRQIGAAGSYRAVLSPDFLPIAAAAAAGDDEGLTQAGLSDTTEGSTIYIYALQADGSSVVAVDSDNIKSALDNTATVIEYIETKEDQTTGGGDDDGSSDTGLIVAVAVLACLLVAVVVAAVLRQRQLSRRPANNYTRQNNESASPGGSQQFHHSPASLRKEYEAQPSATYSNYAFKPSEEEAAAAPDPVPVHFHQSQVDEDRVTSDPPTAASAPLIDIDGPAGRAPSPGGASEEPSAPDEPKPDYSLKSVGFKETVICVTPPEEHHEDEEGEEGEEQEENTAVAGTEQDGVSQETRSNPEADEKTKSDDESNCNSML